MAIAAAAMEIGKEASVSWMSAFTHVQEDLSRLSREVDALRSALASEAQSLRHGLGTMAEAVHAIRAAFAAEVQQRTEAEARLAEHLDLQRADVEARLVERVDCNLRDLRAEVFEISALKVRPRLVALEREANEFRKKLSSLMTQATDQRRHLSPFRGCSGCRSACNNREASISMTVARRALEDTGEALLAQAEEEFHKEALEAAVEAAEKAALQATAEATADAKRLTEANSNEVKKLCDRLNTEASTAESAAAAAARSAASALAVAENRPVGLVEQDVAELVRRMEVVAVQNDMAELSRRLEAEIAGRREAVAEVAAIVLSESESITHSCISKVSEEDKLQLASLRSALTAELQAQSTSMKTALMAEMQSRHDADQCHDEALRNLERHFLKEARAAVSQSEVASEIASSSRAMYESQLSTAENRLGAELSCLRQELGEADATLASSLRATLASRLQEIEGRRVETDAELRSRIDVAVSDVSATAQTALRRALRPLVAEVVAERRQRQVCHEELLDGVVRCEQHTASMRNEQIESCSRQHEVLHHFSEGVARSDEKHKREERGLWTKVHDLTRTLKERVPAERREVLEAAEQSLERGLDRRLSDARTDLQKELCKHFETRSREMRDDIQKALSVQIDKQAKDALVKIDGRANLWSEELRRSEENHSRNEAELLAKRTAEAEEHCEALARSCVASFEEQRQQISQIDAHSQAATTEVQDELRAFIGEQRVFCGFLDAEQKSYQELMELMRREVRALARSVDLNTRRDVPSTSALATLIEEEPALPMIPRRAQTYSEPMAA